jgi:hypothetical protein
VREYARVFKARHRVEDCLRRAKGEAGLTDYQVRTWQGWYHNQTLSLLATWFLTEETRRGKKVDAGVDGPARPGDAGAPVEPSAGVSSAGVSPPKDESALAAERGGPLLALAWAQLTAASKV